MWGPMKNGRKTLDGSFFEAFIISVVLLNTLAMLAYTWNYPRNDTFYDLGSMDSGLPVTVQKVQDTKSNKLLDDINNLFTAFFNVELIIKLLAWGSKQYLADSWNKMDFFVVLVSDAVYLIEKFFTKGLSNYLGKLTHVPHTPQLFHSAEFCNELFYISS